jgi:transcriptional regulator with XRE-family HTH domain
MTIGERIKQRRLELGMSADEVAEKLGKNRSTVFRYEGNDIEKLPTVVLEKLAGILRTTPAYLMGWEEDENNKSPPGQKEKTAPEDGLSDAQRALIQFARTVPEEKAELILRVMKSILEDG